MGPKLLQALRWIRLRFIPLTVEAAFWSGLFYALLLVAGACWNRNPAKPDAPVAAGFRVEAAELDCGLAGEVELELDLELSLLAERINETDIEDPALYVLGQEYIALRAMEKHLSEWQDKNQCDVA